ncbi:MAG: DUF7133 domain-containing protein [Fimbriiglobus sp.]
MRFLGFAMPLVVLLPWLLAQNPKAPTPATIALNGHNFRLAPGYTIELVVGAPTIERPIAAAFDELGRLYVTESSGTNEAPTKQLVSKPHKLYRLSGPKFENREVLIDRLSMPQGVAVVGDRLYVGVPPSIWVYDLSQTPITGREWFNGKTLTGCTNDLHGPYPSPDGYIYWTKGAFAEQTYTLPNGKPFKTKAAHIFRAKADGSRLEPVMTGGMDNPVDVVMMATGDRIFSTTFLQHPEAGRRDGLIHAIPGGIYGKVHDPISPQAHPWTGRDVMPVLTHLGAAAPAGLAYTTTQPLSQSYAGELFTCCFNMAKVTRHVLVPEGSSYRTIDEDLVVSDNRDFHPTDVVVDADGSLLVVDTGGWYRQCCPTSQLVKDDVRGAIYRIRKTDQPALDDPRGLKLDWKSPALGELLRRLDDPRPAVQERVIHQLGELGAEIAAGLFNHKPNTPHGTRNRLWVAGHLGAAGVPIVEAMLKDSDETIRKLALHLLTLHPEKSSVTVVTEVLKTGSASEKRLAAEFLGRVDDAKSTPLLVKGLTTPTDRALQHALTYALIETSDETGIRQALTASQPPATPSLLMALAGIPKALKPEDVISRLSAPDPELRATAWWLLGHRPEFASQFEAYLADAKNAATLGEKQLPDLAKFGKLAAVQKLLASGMAKDLAGKDTPHWEAAIAAKLKLLPTVWEAVVEPKSLGKNPAAWRLAARLLASSSPNPELASAWQKLARQADGPASQKAGYLAALGSKVENPSEVEVRDWLAGVHRDRPAEERAACARVLALTSLTPKHYEQLATVLPTAGTMELQSLVVLFKNAPEPVLKSTLSTITKAPWRVGLRGEELTKTFEKHPEAIRQSVSALVASLNVNAEAQRAKLEELTKEMPKGDIRRGQTVFNSAKAACSSCHAIGYLGGKVGPDLTRIGGIRAERDLLEAIVFPSASFVRSYEPVKVERADGRVHTGNLKRESTTEIVLVVSATEELTIPRSDIDNITPSTVSVMPSGLDQQLSKQDLADLIAFLKASR